MSTTPYAEAPKLPNAEQAVFDALLGLQRNGQPDATAGELREVIERLGLYRVRGADGHSRAVGRIEKGWVNARLCELAERGLVAKREGAARLNPLTGRLADPWCIPAQQAALPLPSAPVSPACEAR
ncbi:hypothetical protein [Macromonas nakdongensis]|uniref:hypothetical protein n=1 Tax=Macromonas nakdongensis TaxID=1843082 RepID=UPI000C336043|nr:hypothetical protein [Macromonas nakdongensis]